MTTAENGLCDDVSNLDGSKVTDHTSVKTFNDTTQETMEWYLDDAGNLTPVDYKSGEEYTESDFVWTTGYESNLECSTIWASMYVDDDFYSDYYDVADGAVYAEKISMTADAATSDGAAATMYQVVGYHGAVFSYYVDPSTNTILELNITYTSDDCGAVQIVKTFVTGDACQPIDSAAGASLTTY